MSDKLYGIYNRQKKEFQFGIKESSKRKARQRLFDKIGNDARKWKFEVKLIKAPTPVSAGRRPNENKNI